MLIQHERFDSGCEDVVENFSSRSSVFFFKLQATTNCQSKERRLPPVPLPSVALEPEQQVGLAVVTTGFPPQWSCTNVTDSTRPRGKDLGSKGFQVSIEHCRRRQLSSLPHARRSVPLGGLTEVELLASAEYTFDAVR